MFLIWTILTSLSVGDCVNAGVRTYSGPIIYVSFYPKIMFSSNSAR